MDMKSDTFTRYTKWFLTEFGDTVENRKSLELYRVGAYRSDKITYTWVGWQAAESH